MQLIDVMKADSNFLTLRNGDHLLKAKQSLIDAMDHALMLMQQIEMLAGGDSNSMVYVKQSELDELKDSKKMLLSLYNNLSNSYHPHITVNGKAGQDWGPRSGQHAYFYQRQYHTTARSPVCEFIFYIEKRSWSQWETTFYSI